MALDPAIRAAVVRDLNVTLARHTSDPDAGHEPVLGSVPVQGEMTR